MVAISDPRIWPPAEAAPAHAAVLHTMAEASLGGRTARESDLRNAEIVVAFVALIRAGDGDALAQVLASAPSAAIHRHLWRQLVLAEAAAGDDAMAVTLFALPIILVAGIEGDRASQATLPVCSTMSPLSQPRCASMVRFPATKISRSRLRWSPPTRSTFRACPRS